MDSQTKRLIIQFCRTRGCLRAALEATENAIDEVVDADLDGELDSLSENWMDDHVEAAQHNARSAVEILDELSGEDIEDNGEQEAED